jgi:hypothetical protein
MAPGYRFGLGTGLVLLAMVAAACEGYHLSNVQYQVNMKQVEEAGHLDGPPPDTLICTDNHCEGPAP